MLWGVIIIETIIIKVIVVVVVRLAGAEGSRVGAEVAHSSVGTSYRASYGVAACGPNPRRLRINRRPVWGSLRAGAVPVWCCQFGAKGDV